MSTREYDSSAARIFIAIDHTGMMELIDQIMTLRKAPGTDPAKISAALDELVETTRDHFDRESDIMSCLSNDDAEAHRAHHRYLLTALTDFADATRSGQGALSTDTAFDLDTWLMFHVQHFDAKLVAISDLKG